MNEELNQEQPNDQDACQKCEEYLAGWKRAQADYANLKRDSDTQKTEFAKFANERLLDALLPAFDQFEIALTFAPKSEEFSDPKRFDGWLNGLKAVRSMWEATFRDIGLERVATDGTFDPNLHEAVAEESVEGKEAGTILRTEQSGWKLHGKLLRPAKVTVVKTQSTVDPESSSG
jgi:molecular chaperone GrpE